MTQENKIMEKINIAELLKDCPEGLELDCTMFEGIEFDSIVNNDCFPIRCRIKNSNDEYNFYSFTKRGYWNNDYKAKCVIFPKGRTTWKGFVPPCQFKDGDIISNGIYIAIFYKIGTPCHCTSSNVVYYHCYYSQKYCNFKKELDFGIGIFTEFKYATEEEKEKLFKAIKDNGYKWNAETKTLEKLPKSYKEETMNKAAFDGNAQCCDIMNNIIKKDMEEIKIGIPKGYEFAGVDDDNQQVVFTKIGYHYPKTYEECYDILGLLKPKNDDSNIFGYRTPLLSKFQKLLICRDAYWKIAGEQLGLDKPWEPDYNEESYEQGSPIKYVIYYTGTYITKGQKCTPSYILAFPSEEMRDAFYENFKELIEECKEFL